MYEIALINVFWDNVTQDTRYFSTIAEQTRYFENLAVDKWVGPLNFLIADRVTTRVTYRDNSGRDIDDILGCNYCVVKRNNEYRYYFARATHDSGNQVVLDLELDDIQTNYFKHKNTIKPCVIERACLNRFKVNNDKTLSFNMGVDSDLYTDEDITAPKYLYSREELEITNDYLPAEVRQWLNDNIVAWRYIFLTNNQYKVRNTNGDYVTDEDEAIQTLKYGRIANNQFLRKNYDTESYKVICVPVFKEFGLETATGLISIYNGDTLFGTISNNIKGFTSENDNTSYVLTQKISKISPFDLSPLSQTGQQLIQYEIVNGGLKIILPKDGIFTHPTHMGFTGAINFVNFYYTYISVNEYPTNSFTTTEFTIPDFKEKFSVNEVINTPLNYKLNPKLFSTNFYDLNITLPEGDTFTYDILKYGDEKGRCLYTEILQPETTKRYMRLDIDENNTNCLYNEAMERNYLGVTSSVNNSVPYSNDQYSAFLSQNKNFWAQSNWKIFGSAVSGAITGGIGGAMLGGSRSKAGVFGAISGGVSSAVLGAIDRAYTIDNMRKAPQSVSNMSGDIFTNLSVNDYNLAVEVYKPLERDLIVTNQYLNMYGFNFGEIGNVSDYDNIRSRFNFVQASPDTITAPISNIEKTRLREKLNKGVRFWNSDTIDYFYENHEKYLEDLNNE